MRPCITADVEGDQYGRWRTVRANMPVEQAGDSGPLFGISNVDGSLPQHTMGHVLNN